MRMKCGMSPQKGMGLKVFEGGSIQKGHGLGGIAKGLFRIAIPLAKKLITKKTMKNLGKHALKHGLAFATKEFHEKAKQAKITPQTSNKRTTHQQGNARRKKSKKVKGKRSQTMKQITKQSLDIFDKNM